MYVLALEMELRITMARSLKDKRAAITPILEGARRRYRVAAAEVGAQDVRRSARLGFAAVASSATHAGEIIDGVERFVWSFPEVEVTSGDRHWVEVI